MGIAAINPAVTDFITAMTEMDHSPVRCCTSSRSLRDTQFVNRPSGEADIKVQTGALVVAVRKVVKNHFVPNPARQPVA